jgi:hypothetical protein
MARIAKFFHPGPWFMVAAGMALVGGDYFTSTPRHSTLATDTPRASP